MLQVRKIPYYVFGGLHGFKSACSLVVDRSRNLVIAIEPMVNLGRKEVRQDKDGWTIRTRDGKPSAHYELAIAITDGEPDILSTFKYIEEVLN